MFRPMLCSRKRFLSTPSARRATTGSLAKQQRTGISIHALREEGDLVGSYHCETHDISIHALREEGDLQTQTAARLGDKFLSTPSARRATRCTRSCANPIANFYPRPPRGGRHFMQRRISRWQTFLSTPSARRATSYAGLSFCSNGISIHALREEGDARSTPPFRRPRYFYPRPPRGGRPTGSSARTS